MKQFWSRSACCCVPFSPLRGDLPTDSSNSRLSRSFLTLLTDQVCESRIERGLKEPGTTIPFRIARLLWNSIEPLLTGVPGDETPSLSSHPASRNSLWPAPSAVPTCPPRCSGRCPARTSASSQGPPLSPQPRAERTRCHYPVQDCQVGWEVDRMADDGKRRRSSQLLLPPS